jgi:hypothetical protein
MDPKFGIFMIIASVLTMAVYSSSANFVSADSSDVLELQVKDTSFVVIQ